jgi:drug/metabolite transporter (DMT)-like permease
VEQPKKNDSPHSRSHRWRGVGLGLTAAAAHALGYVLSKGGIGQYDAVAATLIRVLVAIGGYLVLVTVWRRWPAMNTAIRDDRAMGILTLGAFAGPFTGIVFSLIALRHAPTGVVATIIATMPVLILPFSIFLHREKVSARAIGGAIVAVLGIAMLMLPCPF